MKHYRSPPPLKKKKKHLFPSQISFFIPVLPFTHFLKNWNHLTSVSSLYQHVTISSPYLEKGFTNHFSVLNLLRIKSPKKQMYKYTNVHKHFNSPKTVFCNNVRRFFSQMIVRNLPAGGKIYLQAMLKHSDLLKHSLP